QTNEESFVQRLDESASVFGHERFQCALRDEQAGVFEGVAVYGIVAAFNVQIGIVPRPKQCVDDLGPVTLAETGEAMLGNTRVTKAVFLQQRTIDQCVLCMDVKNS